TQLDYCATCQRAGSFATQLDYCAAYFMANEMCTGSRPTSFLCRMMIMNGTAKPKRMQRFITLNNVPLEQVSRFKYLGSWITEDARSDEDIRARVGMAKAAFWQNKDNET